MSGETFWGLEFLACFVWLMVFLAMGPSKTWVIVLWALLFAGSWHEDGWRWPVSLTLLTLSAWLFRVAWEIYRYQPTAEDFERSARKRRDRELIAFLRGKRT